MTSTVRQLPGQLPLPLDVPEMTDDLRADLAGHVQPGWQAMAACRSVADDTWFPEPGYATAAALDVCKWCPVRASCLAFALSETASDDDFGVWGGTTEAQRDVLRQDLGEGVPVVDVLDGATLRPALEWRRSA